MLKAQGVGERLNQPSLTRFCFSVEAERSAAGESKALDVSESHIAPLVFKSAAVARTKRVGRLARASPGSGFSRLAATPILPTVALSARN